jgi:hypothetical protein
LLPIPDSQASPGANDPKTAHEIDSLELEEPERPWTADAGMAQGQTLTYEDGAVDFDPYSSRYSADTHAWGGPGWRHEFLPVGPTLYPFYLPAIKESRLGAVFVDAQEDSSLLEPTLGGRFGLYRYSDGDLLFPRGWQIDIEGSAQVRLDMEEERDVRSVDYRAGVPIGFSFGRYQVRTGYYHLSSHLGDEFLLKNPGYDRLNFSRDCLILGNAYWLNPDLRVYAEAAWAFYESVSEQWEFLFGIDYAPRAPTGIRGAPFFGIGGHLREELDYGGNLVVQLGWAWRSDPRSGLLRTGFQYLNGNSPQLSFYELHESQLAYGFWYDF